METKRRSARVAVSLLALAGLLVFSLFAVGGSLEPSAPPGPTMKTLDEVEPRIPIHASDLPLTITEPNSYYLVEDINFTDDANNAITIECNDVTIDLMGYTLKGPDSGTTFGIYMNGRSNVEIRNGTVRDFYYGIYEASSLGQDHRVTDVRSVSNGRRGIYLPGKSNLVKGCTASDNGTSAGGSAYGIYVGYGSTVTGNMVYDNGHSATGTVYGIFAGSGSTVTGNTVFGSGFSATGEVFGIYTGPGGLNTDSGSTVTGNTVYGNGYLAGGEVFGIYAGDGSTVTGNTARLNGYSATGSYVFGIRAYSGCTVTGNTAHSNGISATGTVYGIYLSGNNLVDQNTAYNNNGTNMNNPGTCTFGTNHAP